MRYEMDKYTLKKKEIVDVMVSLMDEEGLKKVTVKDICKTANISIGSFYHYFESKDSIVEDMYKLMDEFFLVNESKIKSHEMVSEQIIGFVNHFGIYVEKWGYYGNLLIMSSSVKVKNQNHNSDRAVYSILKSIIEEGIANKQFKVSIDVDELVAIIFALMRGHLLEWIKREHDYKVREKMVTHTKYIVGYLCI
ncbi:MAG: TetR/AcrR family transcriptional regulator [Clostridium sp.]|nr:TetR/AcrR family transcriptional regulator [Clostridium sp.]